MEQLRGAKVALDRVMRLDPGCVIQAAVRIGVLPAVGLEGLRWGAPGASPEPGGSGPAITTSPI